MAVVGTVVALGLNCGGEAIIDGPAAGGGTPTTASRGPATGVSVVSNTAVTSITSTGGFRPGTCEEIEAAYRQALEAARACDERLDIDQCLFSAPSELRCPCSTFVEDESVIDVFESLLLPYADLGCFELPCDDAECPEVRGGECIGDRCVDVGP